MLITKTIKKKWHGNTKKHYETLGYHFTKIGDEFEVDVMDLTRGSEEKVEVQCDYCGSIVIKPYKVYLKNHDEILGDCCKHCRMIKSKNTWLNKYGVSHPFLDNTIQEKRKNTWVSKYGVDNPFKSDEIKEKIKKVHQNNYGVCNISQSEIIKRKKVKTSKKHYGVENVSQSPQIKEKKKLTCLKNFGVEYPMMSSEIRQKSVETLYENGNCPTSKPQLKLCELIHKIYNNCELNYPCGRYSLDCMVCIDGIKIDVEYDGQYFHNKKANSDNIRNVYVSENGYKILRVKGNYQIPSEKQLREAMDRLRYTDENYVEIILDIKDKDMV